MFPIYCITCHLDSLHSRLHFRLHYDYKFELLLFLFDDSRNKFECNCKANKLMYKPSFCVVFHPRCWRLNRHQNSHIRTNLPAELPTLNFQNCLSTKIIFSLEKLPAFTQNCVRELTLLRFCFWSGCRSGLRS
jgi:hypothetical protein